MIDEWHLVWRLFRVPLIDGTRHNGDLMKRTINGVVQYRRLTEAEADQLWQDEQW